MNSIDLAVAAVVLIAGFRGFLRGFLRELFGLLALFAAAVAAIQWSGVLSGMLVESLAGPQVLRDGVAFVAVFLATHLVVNLTGFLLDRLVGALMLRGVNRVTGALFGAAKGAAVAGIALLFIHLFPPLSTFDEQIMTSSVGRPLTNAASTLLRINLREQPGAED